MSNSTTSVLQDILNQRDVLNGIDKEIMSNTQSVFAVLAIELKEQLRTVSSSNYSIRRDADSMLEFELSGLTIGLAIVEGTGLIRDEKVFSTEFYEVQKMKSYKDLILDEKHSKSYAGMIVMYVKIDAGSHIVLSRFYVNKDSQVLYRSEVGWFNMNWFENENLVDGVGQYLLSSIEDAFFEFKKYWRQDHKEFISISDLSESNNIGFKDF